MRVPKNDAGKFTCAPKWSAMELRAIERYCLLAGTELAMSRAELALAIPHRTYAMIGQKIAAYRGRNR